LKQLECGCELSPSGALVSLCHIHGGHMRAVQTIENLPRNKTIDRELEKELTKSLAPLYVAKSLSNIPRTDADTTAQQIFDQVREIMRRLD